MIKTYALAVLAVALLAGCAEKTEQPEPGPAYTNCVKQTFQDLGAAYDRENTEADKMMADRACGALR